MSFATSIRHCGLEFGDGAESQVSFVVISKFGSAHMHVFGSPGLGAYFPVHSHLPVVGFMVICVSGQFVFGGVMGGLTGGVTGVVGVVFLHFSSSGCCSQYHFTHSGSSGRRSQNFSKFCARNRLKNSSSSPRKSGFLYDSKFLYGSYPAAVLASRSVNDKSAVVFGKYSACTPAVGVVIDCNRSSSAVRSAIAFCAAVCFGVNGFAISMFVGCDAGFGKFTVDTLPYSF